MLDMRVHPDTEPRANRGREKRKVSRNNPDTAKHQCLRGAQPFPLTFVDFQGVGTSSNSQIITQNCGGFSAPEAATETCCRAHFGGLIRLAIEHMGQ